MCLIIKNEQKLFYRNTSCLFFLAFSYTKILTLLKKNSKERKYTGGKISSFSAISS
jgi:hypothetical protein